MEALSADASTLRLNKRVEAAPSALMNLGTALTAAISVRLFATLRFDTTVVLWSFATVALI